MDRPRLSHVLLSLAGSLPLYAIVLADLKWNGLHARLAFPAVAALIFETLARMRRAGESQDTSAAETVELIASGPSDSMTIGQIFHWGAVLCVGATAWIYSAELFRTAGNYALENEENELASALFEAAIYGDRLPQERQAHAQGQLSSLLRDRARSVLAATDMFGENDAAALESLEISQRALDLAPESIEAMFMVGEAYRALGAYPEALEVIGRALQLDVPNAHWSLIRMAQTHRAAHQYQDAEDYLDRVLALWGDRAGMPIHYHRGRLFFALGRYEEAIEEFTAGLPRQPDYVWAHLYRACSHAMIGEYDDAVEGYKVGLKYWWATEDDLSESEYVQNVDRVLSEEFGRLRVHQSSGTREAPSGYCMFNWSMSENYRERSPLLPEQPLDD